MFSIDSQSRIPIFEQIKFQTEEYIRLGILKSGDRLPSIRELTEGIGVNPNTVQRAYAELDYAGIIVSAAGRGCFVSSNAVDRIKDRAEKRLPELEALVHTLYLSGVSEEKLMSAVKAGMNSASSETK